MAAFLHRMFARKERHDDNDEVLVRAYGKVLEENSGELISDARLLPAPKDVLKGALIQAIKSQSPDNRRLLRNGFVLLAQFQSLSDRERDEIVRWKKLMTAATENKTLDELRQEAAEFVETGRVVSDVEGRIAAEGELLLAELHSAGF